jgi:PleD family two-component response regulator
MKILIIDRDEMFASLLAGKIRAAGHEAVVKPMQNDVVMGNDTIDVDAIFFDPTPHWDPKTLLVQIRRMVRNYPYTIIMSEGMTLHRANKCGCNDGLAKPFDPAALTICLENAERMTSLIRQIGDERIDFPSGGGVISKSAFNQLFLTAIDRVTRYNELSHVLFISVSNYDEIKALDGKYAADYAVSKLAQNVVQLRRQSDILGQTAVNEYALLLQRPLTDQESPDAARRFAATFGEIQDLGSPGLGPVDVRIDLVNLPNGNLDFTHTSRLHGLVPSFATV